MKGGGTTRSVIIIDVELARICTLIVCEHMHRHAKHANKIGESGACPHRPQSNMLMQKVAQNAFGNFLKFLPSCFPLY